MRAPESELEPHQVRVFLKVAETGSFTRAADLVHRTQSAVSMAVKSLEEALGHQLFDRLPKGVRLTEEGEAFRELAAPLLSAWAGLPERMDEALTGEPAGRLVVGAGEAILLRWLPAVVKRYRKRHPQVELVLRHQPRAQSFRELREGAIDLAVRSTAGLEEGFDVHPLVESERVLLARKGTGLPRAPTAARLADHEFVLPREGSQTRRALVELFEREGLEPQVALESGGWGLLKAHAAAGLGVAVLPDVVLSKADSRRFELRRLGGLLEKERYALLRDPRRPASRAAQAFTEACLSHAG